MSYYTPDELNPRRPEHIDHQVARRGGGWRILVGIAAVAILALLVFGPDASTTTDVHPGGAGAPPVAVQDSTAPVVPVE